MREVLSGESDESLVTIPGFFPSNGLSSDRWRPYFNALPIFASVKMISITELIVALAGVWLIYLVTLAVYRLYFSPLAQFPGPKLAALTLWYEFYHDVIKRGRYTWKIGELHKRYGRL